jgi:hypothetical protein
MVTFFLIFSVIWLDDNIDVFIGLDDNIEIIIWLDDNMPHFIGNYQKYRQLFFAEHLFALAFSYLIIS